MRQGYTRHAVATAQNMLHVMSGALRSKTLYRDLETDYKALIVQRNAPRWIRMLKKYGIDAITG